MLCTIIYLAFLCAPSEEKVLLAQFSLYVQKGDIKSHLVLQQLWDFFFITQIQILTRCILYQIKSMNLRNINIGDVIAVKLNKISEITLYVPWYNDY